MDRCPQFQTRLAPFFHFLAFLFTHDHYIMDNRKSPAFTGLFRHSEGLSHQETAPKKYVGILYHCGGDNGHLVDLVSVAATGQIIDGRGQALQDGAVGLEAAQALGDLVADVAGLDVGEDEGVGVAGHGRAGELQLAHFGSHGGIELHLAVDGQLGSHFLGHDGSVVAQLHGAALAGAVGGEAQHGDLGIDAEDLGGAGGLDGHLGQLLGGGQGHVAFLVNAVLVAQVDGAVAHGQLLFAPDQDEAGGHQMGALLGFHQLQSGTDGIGSGIGSAAQQRIGVAHLHQHGAEVVALGKGLAAVLGGHFALAELHHLVYHLVHLGIGGGVDDLHALNVEAALFGIGLDFLHVADEDGGQEAALHQASGSLQDPGIMALGEDDLSGVRLQSLDHSIEHDNLLQIYGPKPLFSPFYYSAVPCPAQPFF